MTDENEISKGKTGEQKLTELEKDVLLHGLYENEYNQFHWDDGIIGASVYANSICYNCKLVKKNQISGVVSSLVKKGILNCWDDENGQNVFPTDFGHEVFAKLIKTIPTPVQRALGISCPTCGCGKDLYLDPDNGWKCRSCEGVD